MATLQLSEAQARKIYPAASEELRTILEDTFTKDFFNQKITDRLKTVLDAYAVTGTPYIIPEGLTPDEVAYRHLKVVVKALNEGWTPNWDNDEEAKYYPWFCLDAPSGFCLDAVYWSYTISDVGFRLRFRSRELAEYAARQFHDLYKQFFTA